MLALTVALAAGLLAAPAALAGVRTAVVTDARDGWTTATGQPSTPDLLRAEVIYDTAGTLSMNVDFAEDVRGLATDRAYAWSLRYTIGKPSDISATTCVPIVTGAAQIAVFNGAPIQDRLAIKGTDGYLPYTVQFQYPPDVAGTRLSFTATSPALVGRDLRCLAFAIAGRELGSEEDPGTVLDEVCTCWYLAVTDDTAPLAWFAGFQPKPGELPTTPKPQPKPTGPRRPSAIRVSLDRNYCQLSVAMWSLTPGFTDPPTTKWGALVVTVTGPTRRTVRQPLGNYVPGRSTPIALLRRLPGGTYTVRSQYSGDAWRKPSPPVVKSMRIVCV
jgi:hypothetical protein